ncbi:hypothetical protein AMTR_s00089p00072800 [Amborella trichopoda]|uniref:Uncharacterized protein n=1 Tax=Amborella trichopoda TaxID=13333 RepID=W1P4F2_AMBTC|nr:hypothetical protein AMTR_s00089p00072800 [Amborella trichopoda]
MEKLPLKKPIKVGSSSMESIEIRFEPPDSAMPKQNLPRTSEAAIKKEEHEEQEDRQGEYHTP